MPRLNLKPGKKEKAGAYLEAPATPSDLRLFSSGSALIDCVLGGGWALGRMSNIIGDKSTAKTGLAIEAMANFARQFPKGWIRYREAESAFDVSYAESMGLPRKRVKLWGDEHNTLFDTVEDMYEDLESVLAKSTTPGLYIVDSLDALSDRAEKGRKIDENSYGGNKAKKMGEFFRRLVRPLEEKEVCLLIISQVRANIGAMFGEKYTRTGGKAMDFYATHCLWLAHLGIVSKTRRNEKRATAVNIRAKCKKNKIGKPFRDCDFEYRFDYGIADVESNLAWLDKVKRLKAELGYDKPEEFLKQIEGLSDEDYRQAAEDLAAVVKAVWEDIDHDFAPTRRKYA